MIQQLDLSGPIRYAQTLKQASEAADLQEQQKTEGQLNIKKLQMAIDQATKDQKENDQIKARIAQGGDPESIAADINKINPDKGAKYYQDLRAQQLAKRQEAIQNYQANPNPAMPMQSVAQPPISVAAPQPVVAPAPNLPGSTVPAPQPQTPSILRNVNLPNRWQMAPAPDVTIPSATGGEPLVIPGVNQEQAIAREQAAKRFATDEAIRAKAAEGVVIPEGGVLHREGAPDVVGQPKLSDIEKEAEPWLAKNPGKTLPDYVKQKAMDIAQSSEYGQELNAFTANPSLVKQFGAGPMGLAGKKQADQIQVHEREAEAAVRAQQALAQGAVKNVQPHLVIPATEAYKKDSNAYVDAAQAAADMNDFVNDAKAGNKVAYSFIPAEGALYLTTSRGVKRINLNEMNAYSGGGSAWDRFTGFIGKQLSGASIPADILKDMGVINAAVGQNAKTAYQRKVAVTNQAFGSTFQPMDFGGTGPTGNKTVNFNDLPK